MTRRFLQVDVFGESPFLGNPLAVVLDADDIDDAAMARIARLADVDPRGHRASWGELRPERVTVSGFWRR
jgi:hypothetical protein